jgi:hypothetical protein
MAVKRFRDAIQARARRETLRGRIWLALAVGVILYGGLVPVVWAAPLVVDPFTEQTQRLSVGVGKPLDMHSSDSAPSLLGGERDAVLELVSGTSASYLDINAGGSGEVGFSAGSGNHLRATITWDGDDNDPLTLDPDGLGGVDLVDDTNDGVVLEINHWDGNDLEITVAIYTSQDDYSIARLSLLEDGEHPPACTYTLSFQDDFQAVGSGADFSQVGAIQVTFQTITTGADVSLELLSMGTARDFGDLPASYGITRAEQDGARHRKGGTFLGDQIDTELDAHQLEPARGDNQMGMNDEDGVTRVGAWENGPDGGTVQFNVHSAHPFDYACLDGWVDWNQDHDFDDPLEHVIDSLFLYDLGTVNNLTQSFDVPEGTFGGSGTLQLYARWRIMSEKNGNASCVDELDMGYQGYIPGGEVEDYVWTFEAPSSIRLISFSARHSHFEKVVLTGLLVFAGCLTMGGVIGNFLGKEKASLD